ncbi:hypothetical protein EVG20_g10513 [Dentipellis fragilis]|uniref:Uncharacterized protein n=1 Tax=Dentipellis fragilis TaxID=205917 RepID=A0A4Y9XQD3_9AGAM|nr:hypothetical protein EVG20_g10513 [Dentipellis fragilis]
MRVLLDLRVPPHPSSPHYSPPASTSDHYLYLQHLGLSLRLCCTSLALDIAASGAVLRFGNTQYLNDLQSSAQIRSDPRTITNHTRSHGPIASDNRHPASAARYSTARLGTPWQNASSQYEHGVDTRSGPPWRRHGAETRPSRRETADTTEEDAQYEHQERLAPYSRHIFGVAKTWKGDERNEKERKAKEREEKDKEEQEKRKQKKKQENKRREEKRHTKRKRETLAAQFSQTSNKRVLRNRTRQYAGSSSAPRASGYDSEEMNWDRKSWEDDLPIEDGDRKSDPDFKYAYKIHAALQEISPMDEMSVILNAGSGSGGRIQPDTVTVGTLVLGVLRARQRDRGRWRITKMPQALDPLTSRSRLDKIPYEQVARARDRYKPSRDVESGV